MAKKSLKSTETELRKRGWVTEEDIKKLSSCSTEELFFLLSSGFPAERTAAVSILSHSDIDKLKLADFLLELLEREPCLYTRLEICNFLEKGNAGIAVKMISYLAKIGNNQHTRLPDRVSAKSSYPLPRDIIARSLWRMDVSVLPVLMGVLASGTEKQIAEALDAIGYMVFYNPSVATSVNLSLISDTMKRYENHPVIYWKCIMVLSAFPIQESLDILDTIISVQKDNIFGKEARRSVRLACKMKDFTER